MIAMIFDDWNDGLGAFSSIPCVLRTRPLRGAKGRRVCWYGLRGCCRISVFGWW